MQTYLFLLLFLIPRGISKLYFIRLPRIPYRTTLIRSTRFGVTVRNSPVRMKVRVRLNPEKLSPTNILLGSVFDISYNAATCNFFSIPYPLPATPNTLCLRKAHVHWTGGFFIDSFFRRSPTHHSPWRGEGKAACHLSIIPLFLSSILSLFQYSIICSRLFLSSFALNPYLFLTRNCQVSGHGLPGCVST